MNTQALLDWFSKLQRPLPWRADYEPYQVWISEIMLQQTQVKTVLPYYERWIQAFPDVQSLAEAPLDQVLKLWEGLGYYSRARNLHKAAQLICEQHGGRVPSRYDELRALPGIGPYTAGAILSIAFNQAEAAVDGNVMRVFSRLEAFEEDPRTQAGRVEHWVLEHMPSSHARDFNQALMEFGALLCTPKSPKCEACPLRTDCQMMKQGLNPTNFPRKKAKTEKVKLNVAVALLHHEGRIFVQKRPEEGLMAGLWEFPGGKLEEGESPLEALQRELDEELRLQIDQARPFMRLKHAYTKYLVDLEAFWVDLKEEPKLDLLAASESKWASLRELEELTFPAANRKLIESLKSAIMKG